VEEFPEYLQTIAHCARKSDVAVWQYFFSVVGNPIDLFQVGEAVRMFVFDSSCYFNVDFILQLKTSLL